jgi:hypothetical protein
MPVAIEQHADWIADCIEHMRDAGLERIEAWPDSMDKPAHRLIGRARVQRAPPGCPSYVTSRVGRAPFPILPVELIFLVCSELRLAACSLYKP